MTHNLWHYIYFFDFLWIKKYVSHRLKPSNTNEINNVYKFTCNCQKIYIGETRHPIEHRVNQHIKEKASAVYEHISNCEDYLTNLDYYNNEERPKIIDRLRDRSLRKRLQREKLHFNLELKFLVDHFVTLANNLKFHDRKTYEAIEIKKYSSKVKLNRQNDFVRSLRLIQIGRDI